MIDRKELIKQKGFSMAFSDDDTEYLSPFNSIDFAKLKVGAKTLDDAVLALGDLNKANDVFADKQTVIRAINDSNFEQMKEISNFFYKTSGIYSRLCRYMAYLYRYDWMVTPYINDNNEKNVAKALQEFYKVLGYLDDFGIKKFLGEAALKVIKYGSYYGYMIQDDDKLGIQELPQKYCRSRFVSNGIPAIEFNMKFFDDSFKDTTQKMKMLNLFPKEFKKGYIMYKEGKLPPQFSGDTSGWYLLDITKAFKFNINGEDFPGFISVIPAIIDLDGAKGIDRKKMEQDLLKILIQKMPLDKNGDIIFDIDEAQALHNNAVNMLSKAVGIDVLTTFADVQVANTDSSRAATARDDLERVERSIYNEAGVSQMQFNTDGNIALEKSILNDESSMYNLLTQFEQFLNRVINNRFNKNKKKYYFKIQLLTTTIYNYKELSKMYKEQMQLGFSKMLPQIALGQTQSSILANAYFENDVLNLIKVFIPPLMSSTMNVESLKTLQDDGDLGGRPTNESLGEPVSEKTIQNKESQS